MAALSCYQPCRSHLAQPARCFDDEDDDPPPSFSIRRRQFIERCYDARARLREDTSQHNEQQSLLSVKRTREELVKNAAPQTQPRRLNIESGWSKVEEVRKKFEGAAAGNSFSRSFESPPRRRLADSLFASFKLPRKKENNMAAPRSMVQPHAQQKRKSAVELLQETKAFYVKSETVLDRKQELPLRVSSGLSQAIAQGGCHLVSSGTLNNDACCNPYATTRLGGARRAVSAGEGLQNTLRRLLEHADSRENVYSPAYGVHKLYPDPRRLKEYPDRDMSRSQHNSGTFSGTSSSGTSGSKAQKGEDHRDKMNRPLSFGDARVFFPESFVIPRQRAEVVIKSAYSIPSSHSSPDRMLLPEPVASAGGSPEEPVGAISPPANYAHSCTPRYIRSNSHSQPSVREEDGCTNINSHKSLPDLHTQARCYADHMVTSGSGGGGTVGRSPRRRRHSPHQRTASCSSKGTRSNHSSLLSSCEGFSEHPSPGEDNYPSYNSRCGSSFARDSGGSSGHYTQRSAPSHSHSQRDRDHPSHSHPHTHTHPRNDSGSSTQHELSRYNYYPEECNSLEAVVVCAPPQFQDGAPSPPPPPIFAHTDLTPGHAMLSPLSPLTPHPRVGIHFQASAPPPQFQDDPPVFDYTEYDCSYNPGMRMAGRIEREYPSRDYGRYHDPLPETIIKQPAYEPRALPRALPLSRTDDRDVNDYGNTQQMSETIIKQPAYEPRALPRALPMPLSRTDDRDVNDYGNTQQMVPPPEEVTSPLGTFKRQRCLRYKQRRPRPILRSKSDISDRYRRTDGRSPASAPCEGEDSPDSPEQETARLQAFFERLGLEARQYDAIVLEPPPESPVFFSSASTVDSNQLATVDFTVQGPGGVAGGGPKPAPRSLEPPSVVERNARIIKWLCQCRKLQLLPPP